MKPEQINAAELEQIVIKAQNGSEEAKEELYHASVRYAYTAASSILTNHNDIEDALQNTFLYVFKYIKSLRSPESYLKWLNVITIHEASKIVAQNSRSRKIISAVVKDKEIKQTPDVFESEIIKQIETSDLIRQIVQELPEEKRRIIELYYFEKHTYSEIAKILGIPIGTVMSRLHNAKRSLEKEFKKLEKEGTVLWGIGIVPTVTAIFAAKRQSFIPSAIEGRVLSALTADGAIATISTASSGFMLSSAAAVGTGATASAMASGVLGSAAIKVAAGVLATTVAIGGGAAAVSRIKNDETSTAFTENTVTQEWVNVERGITTKLYSAPREPTYNPTEKIPTEGLTRTSPESMASTQTTSIFQPTAKSATASTKVVTSSSIRPTSTQSPTARTSTATSKATTAGKTPATTVPTTQRTTANNTNSTVFTNARTTATPSTRVETQPTTTSIADLLTVSGGVLRSYSGSGGSVNIPSTINGDYITAIGTGAFSGSKVTAVSIPNGVTKIGQEAFSECSSLNSISLPSSLETIGIGAFNGCSSLSSVSIPNGTSSIGDDAFSGCSLLSTISIPSSVISIGDDAFDGCKSLTILCAEGSYAEGYAQSNNIHYSLT